MRDALSYTHAIAFIEIAFRREPLVAILCFYCDESGKHRKNPVITVTGVGGISPHIQNFVLAWEVLLRSYELGPELHMSRIADLSQACGPKMPANQTIDERIDALMPFADCINDNLEVGLIQAWDVKGYNNMSLEAKKQLGGSHDPYQLAFIRGLLGIGDYAGEDGLVSIIADDDEVTAWDTYVHFRAIGKALPELRKKLTGITFAQSEHFKPLQAADMVAFLARRQASEEFFGNPNEFRSLLDYLTAGPRSGSDGVMKWFKMFASEQMLLELANAVIDGKKPRIPKV